MPGSRQGTQSFKAHGVMGWGVGDTQCWCDAVGSRPEGMLGHFGGIWGHRAFCLLGGERDEQADDTRKGKETRREQLAQVRPSKVRPERDF